MPAVKTFDPKKVTVIVGPYSISGYAKGTFIQAEYQEDLYKTVVGADGETTRVRNNNRSGKITITLHNSSLSNADLTALKELDDTTGNGKVPVFIHDNSGYDTAGSPEAWVSKMPAMKKGDDVENYEWVLDCRDFEPILGGNQ